MTSPLHPYAQLRLDEYLHPMARTWVLVVAFVKRLYEREQCNDF